MIYINHRVDEPPRVLVSGYLCHTCVVSDATGSAYFSLKTSFLNRLNRVVIFFFRYEQKRHFPKCYGKINRARVSILSDVTKLISFFNEKLRDVYDVTASERLHYLFDNNNTMLYFVKYILSVRFFCFRRRTDRQFRLNEPQASILLTKVELIIFWWVDWGQFYEPW